MPLSPSSLRSGRRALRPGRPLRLAALLALLALPAAAAARPWQGIVPGQSTRAEVVARFGEPSTQGKLGERTALVYKGEQALPGTRQAQLFLREDGVVLEITVFPSAGLDKESVEGTYGKGAQKTFTDDFRPVWLYKGLGVTVFFGKEGTVDAISFKPAEKAAEPPGAGTGAGPASGGAGTHRSQPSLPSQARPAPPPAAPTAGN